MAMGMTSVLALIVITGSLFIQKYINRWTGESKLLEEASFVQATLKSNIEAARTVNLFEDSLIVISPTQEKKTFVWHSGGFETNGKSLLKKEVTIKYLEISKIKLPVLDSLTKLPTSPEVFYAGLYKLRVQVSEKGKKTDTLTVVVKNQNEYLKFSQTQKL